MAPTEIIFERKLIQEYLFGFSGMSKQGDKKKPEKETGKIKGSGSIRGRIKRYPGSQEKKTLKNHVWTRVIFVVEEGTHGLLEKKSNHQY